MSSHFNGFINLNKPLHWTSHDCVARVRRLLNMKKIGHGGTLDPLATGVLPIAMGRATRLIQYLPERKVYCAVIRFGLTTTTDDLAGEVLTEQVATHLQREAVEAHLPQFLGCLSQVPPMYSAVQVQGKRLYHLARQGKTVEIPPRQVMIHQLTGQGWQAGEQPELTLMIDCGPGTYIRSLARDLGQMVGTGATLAQLSRTHSSGFDIASSMTLADLEEAIASARFVPSSALKAVQHLAALTLSPSLAHRWCMGQKLSLAEPGISGLIPQYEPLGIPLRIMDDSTGDFLGIGEIRAVPPVESSDNLWDNELPHILVAKCVFRAVD